MKNVILAAAAVALSVGSAAAQTTSYLGVQYGLPNIGANQGSGCTPGYASCFTIPLGRQLRECKGTFTIKQPNVVVLVLLACGPDAIVAMESERQGTIVWSSPTLSNSDPALLGNGSNMCQIDWAADNNTPEPISPGAAFEIQGVCSTY